MAPRAVVLAALALSALSCAATTPAPPSPTPPRAARPAAPPPRAPRDEVADFVDVLNRHRVAVGCPRLQWHEGAAEVAQAHAEDMRKRGYFDHVDPDGVGMRARLTRAGVNARPAAENLADAPFGGERLLKRWLVSPVHRGNIDDCGFTHHGIGRAGDLWTHLFLTVRPARPAQRER